MTAFVDIKPGQWVLAFDQPYGPYDRKLPEHLEMFAYRGGDWDSHHASEIFIVHLVDAVAPKTYQAQADTPESMWRQRARPAGRYYRSHVIAAGATKDEMISLRDRFFAIGAEADDQIDFVVERLARPIRARVRKKAVKEVRACLPQHFGRKL